MEKNDKHDVDDLDVPAFLRNKKAETKAKVEAKAEEIQEESINNSPEEKGNQQDTAA